MISFSAITVIGMVSTWALSPRFFSYFDSRLARRRLHGSLPSPPRQHASAAKVIHASAPAPKHDNRLIKLSAMTDLLARESRSGMPSVEVVLTELRPGHPDDDICKELWMSCVVNGVFVSSALDHAASLMRDMAACRADVAVAASQARLSARMLSPFLYSCRSHSELCLIALAGRGFFVSSINHSHNKQVSCQYSSITYVCHYAPDRPLLLLVNCGNTAPQPEPRWHNTSTPGTHLMNLSMRSSTIWVQMAPT